MNQNKANRIEVFHLAILVVYLIIIVIFIILVDPSTPPVDHIQLFRAFRSQSQPLHSRATLGALTDFESVYPWNIYITCSALLPAMRIGVDERRRA